MRRMRVAVFAYITPFRLLRYVIASYLKLLDQSAWHVNCFYQLNNRLGARTCRVSKGYSIMDPMGWLAWIIIGALAGWLASVVMRSRQGLIMDIIVGIVGAIIGGFLFSQVGAQGITGFNIWSLFVAFIGAVILLGVLRVVGRSTAY